VALTLVGHAHHGFVVSRMSHIVCVCRVREGKCVCIKGCIFALKADIHNQFLYIRLKMS